MFSNMNSFYCFINIWLWLTLTSIYIVRLLQILCNECRDTAVHCTEPLPAMPGMSRWGHDTPPADGGLLQCPCSVCSAAWCHDVITWCVIVAECGGWPGGWSGCGGGSAILTAVGAVTADCGGWTKTGAGVSLPGPGPGHQPPEPELPLLRHIPLAEAAVRRPAAGVEIEAMTDICQRWH